MTLAWPDFVVLAAVIKELFDAIKYFKSRGKNHFVVRAAAEKYRRCFANPDFVELMGLARTRLKIAKFLRQDFVIKIT